MNDIGIGAVGAAVIAGLISLLGLIITKEQKVSEFRQAWINDLRTCLVSYLASINAIADAIRVARSRKQKPTDIEQNYKALNEANHGIRLRVNDTEQPSIKLLKSMDDFELLASENSQLTPANIRAAEADFLSASKELLKFEWNRVKRGERTYYWTKNIVIGLISVMLIFFFHLWHQPAPIEPDSNHGSKGAGVTNADTQHTNAIESPACKPQENTSIECKIPVSQPTVKGT